MLLLIWYKTYVGVRSRPTGTYPEITVRIFHTSITNSYVEVTRSMFLIVRMWHHISYDIISSRISVQSFVDGWTMWLVMLTRDHDLDSDAWQMRRASVTHTSFPRLVVESSFFWTPWRVSTCLRYESKEETATSYVQPSSPTWVRAHTYLTYNSYCCPLHKLK